MAAIDVRAVDDDDVAPLTRVLARAFATDPCMTWVFRDDATRIADLTMLFSSAWAAYLPQGLCVTTADRAGTALWAAPGGWRTPDDIGREHGERMSKRYDAATWARLMSFFGLSESLHPEEPHYYLGVLGADPERQGQGLGSACLRKVLARVDEEAVPAYLESSNEKNVPLYERHGFEVAQRVRVPDGGPPLWLMWREPGDPAFGRDSTSPLV